MSYFDTQLGSGDILQGEKCFGYNACESHERIVYNATGCELKDFYDPRPGKDGKRIYPDRYFISVDGKRVKGINFCDGQGNFVCSYVGDDYGDLVNENQKDVQESRQAQCRDANLHYGTKRTKISPRIGDRVYQRTYSTTELEKSLPYDDKSVKLNTREEAPALYEKYDGLIHPINGHRMTCTAVYTSQTNDGGTEGKIQYVEFLDEKNGESYYYIRSIGQGVDEQIAEDIKLEGQKQSARQVLDETNTMKQGAKRS